MKDESAEAVKTAPRSSGKDVGIDSEDVSHGHECGNTGHDFGLHVSVVFLQVKKFFKVHKCTPFFLRQLVCRFLYFTGMFWMLLCHARNADSCKFQVVNI